MPTETFDTLYDGSKRPAWAGSVEITVEELLHVRHGAIRRTSLVKGIVCPMATTGRTNAPESMAPLQIGQSSRPTAKTKAFGARNTGQVDMDKGHVMALELGGPDVPSNIVPQWSQWQRNGEWRRMEKEIQDRAVKLLKDGLHLLYHAIVHYKQYENPALATVRGFSIPTGFEIHLSTLRSTGTGWVVVGNEKFRDLEQSQDQTDDMMALRAMMELERRFDPSFDPTEVYPDLVMKRGKLSFGADGQSPVYRPDRAGPPVTYSLPQSGPAPAVTTGLVLNARVTDALPTGRITRSKARAAAGKD